MPMNTELAFFYGQGKYPVSAKCRLCGDSMPQSSEELPSLADTVLWLSQRFIEHKQQKHPAALAREESPSPRAYVSTARRR